MKPEMLCLLLLSGCTYTPEASKEYEYALTWSCLSPEGCTRTDQVELLDRAYIHGAIFDLESTRNDRFLERAELVSLDSLPPGCFLVYSLSLFAHELEPPDLCFMEDDFELTLSIPNRGLETHSMWRVRGQDRGPVTTTVVKSSSADNPPRHALDTGE
jgi:hypothetical protein